MEFSKFATVIACSDRNYTLACGGVDTRSHCIGDRFFGHSVDDNFQHAVGTIM